MNNKLYLNIAIRIIVLFTIGMLGTFITENLTVREFLGDQICTDKTWGCGIYDHNYEWGVRHYWYSTMMLCLFGLSVINVLGYIIKQLD